ncbi:MBL fold metallo-hydrolase [Streptomyces sp. I05A-00742]|uniref:MBL fold metallo-hydrolase n=1 Tax=Streptomyces sp. I05A-00742 TaxID=2732853 RepID=UPI001488F6B4|nr:MBL fold metallo-hydrolase [Streptomyces sp. I05A-00742]
MQPTSRTAVAAVAAEVVEVADGVHAYLQPDGGWCLNNAGFVVGSGAVTVIDTAASEARAHALREAVAAVTPTPVRTVVNTHSHGDHTFGNFVFPEAEVLSHDIGRVEVIEAGLTLQGLWPDADWGEVTLRPPTATFTDRLTLHRGDTRLELLHLGPAHTVNDVVVWLPAERVLFAGDIAMSGVTPFVLMGSVSGSLAVLEELAGLGARTVVCGHGPLAGPEVLEDNARYLRWLQETAAGARRAGLTPLEAAREADLGEFAGLIDAERLLGNLHRAYAEDAGAAPGARLDVVAVFEEMVTFNGGRLPACRI